MAVAVQCAHTTDGHSAASCPEGMSEVDRFELDTSLERVVVCEDLQVPDGALSVIMSGGGHGGSRVEVFDKSYSMYGSANGEQHASHA